jgi:hypothetical protein
LYVSREMKQQQTTGYQLELSLKPACHGPNGEGGTGSEGREARQVSPVADRERALTQDLMERVSSLANLKGAVRKVIRNKGSAGADGNDCPRPERMVSGELGDVAGAIENRGVSPETG